MNQAGRLLSGLTNFFIAIVVGFLGVRFILRLFGANPNSSFVDWVYDTSAELLAPFRGIFPTATLESGFAIEFSTLFAMLVYALIGYLVLALINAVTPDSNNGVVVKETRRRKS